MIFLVCVRVVYDVCQVCLRVASSPSFRNERDDINSIIELLMATIKEGRERVVRKATKEHE